MENNNYTKIDFLNAFKQVVDSNHFSILAEQPDNSYFPEFVENKLDSFLNFYETNLSRYIYNNRNIFGVNSNEDFHDPIWINLNKLSTAIKKCLYEIYNGNSTSSSNNFFELLQELVFPTLKLTGNSEQIVKTPIYIKSINSNNIFYRATLIEESSFEVLDRKRLFHTPFQIRNSVESYRYNTIGTPALYLAGSAYVCWEELNRKPINKLYFTALKLKENTEKKLIALLRIQDTDFYDEIISGNFQNKNEDSNHAELIILISRILNYITAFPLIYACTIKVKDRKKVFRPEYIIPQLLVEYIKIKTGDQWQGIMYPSTKVNYETTSVIGRYNYVFPIKKSKKDGYCPELIKMFELKKPISLEIEDLLSNTNHKSSNGLYVFDESESIMLDGISNRPYRQTAFGRIEELLNQDKNIYMPIEDANVQ